MLVEINGAGFSNKGAQLMLETTVHQLRQYGKDVDFAIAAGRDRPAAEVARLGLKYLWPSNMLYGRAGKYKSLFAASNIISKLAPSRYLAPYGLVKRIDADALIDASGYAFGGHWGVRPMLNMAVLAKSYHRRGKPVVLLPQMLGPFDTAPSQEAFVQLAKYCSRIYARDNTSFQNAAALIDDSILSLSPDVTIASVSNKPIDETKGKTEQVCMVPNQRVLDSGETPWSEDDYLNFFCQSAKQIIAAGKDISVVVHDRGGEDIKLAHSLLNKLDSPNASLFTADNPIELKRHISQSRFLIGSRFHSIVAALSSDIPAIALGWAHKYTELLTDYGQEKYDLKSYQEMENAPGLICEMLDDERLAKNKSCISDRNKMLQKQISTMWSEVATILGLQPS